MSRELGKTFIDELLAKLPEGQRAKAAEVFSSAEAASALDHAGSTLQLVNEAGERKTALDQKEARLNKWHKDLDGWAKTKESEYAEREGKIRTREADPNNPVKDPPPAGTEKPGLTAEAISGLVADTLSKREGAYVGLVAESNQLTSYHLRNFNEDLDVAALVQHPKFSELGLKGVYELTHKDKIQGLITAAETKKENDIRADERKKVMDEQAKQGQGDVPYPIGEGSPLDYLSLPDDKRPKGDPAAAARMYQELTTAR